MASSILNFSVAVLGIRPHCDSENLSRKSKSESGMSDPVGKETSRHLTFKTAEDELKHIKAFHIGSNEGDGGTPNDHR